MGRSGRWTAGKQTIAERDEMYEGGEQQVMAASQGMDL